MKIILVILSFIVFNNNLFANGNKTQEKCYIFDSLPAFEQRMVSSDLLINDLIKKAFANKENSPSFNLIGNLDKALKTIYVQKIEIAFSTTDSCESYLLKVSEITKEFRKIFKDFTGNLLDSKYLYKKYIDNHRKIYNLHYGKVFSVKISL